MKKRRKKLIILLLVLAMCTSFIPNTIVFAEVINNNTQENVTNEVQRTDAIGSWGTENTTSTAVDQNGIAEPVRAGKEIIKSTASDKSGISATYSITTTLANELLLGDVNTDGKINIIDYILLKKYIDGGLNPINEENADINKDTKVNILDYLALGKMVLADESIKVASVELNKTILNLTIGQTETLTTTVLPETATNRTVAWESSNTGVAKVYADGKVEAVASGTATIKCKASDGSEQSESCIVTVTEVIPATVKVTSVALNKTILDLTLGQSETLTTTVLPETATNKAVAWESSNTAVVKVYADGKVEAVASGTATIKCTSSDGSNLSATSEVTVRDGAPVTAESEFEFDVSTGTIIKYIGTSTEVVIPSAINGVSVTSIGNTAFEGCSRLISVTIPNSVTSIMEDAFSVCSSLTSIIIPNSVRSIGKYAFFLCSSLTSITIPDSVVSIGQGAFAECSSLESINIPDSVTSIVEYAFQYCIKAMFYVKSENIKQLLINARVDESKIILNGQVPIIKVTSITLENKNLSLEKGNKLTIIATVVPSTASNKTMIWKSSNPIVATVNENGEVIAVGAGAATITCAASDGSAKSATCAVTVTEKATSVELNKTNLDLVVKQTDIVTALVFPNTASDKTVTWKSSNTDVATVESNGKVTAVGVGTATITCTTSDGSGKSGICEVTVKLGNSDFMFFTFDSSTGTILKYIGSDATVVIPSTINGVSVTSIGQNAFLDCSSVISITIPNGVKVIGKHAFTQCRNLTTVIIPNSVEGIGFGAFWLCERLKNIDIPSSINSIGDYAFYFCSDLENVIIPDGVTKIEVSTFYGCDSLKSIVIPDSVISIDNNAFRSCYNAVFLVRSEKVKQLLMNAGIDDSKIILTDQPGAVKVTEIKLDKTIFNMSRGNTITLTATVSPNIAINKSVAWSTSNSGVATVDENGKVTATRGGTAIITCTAKDGSGKFAVCEVKVIYETSVTLSEDHLSLEVTNTSNLIATVLSNSADNVGVTWKSSNESIAAVDENGKVTAIGKGTAIITCTANDGSGTSVACLVTVTMTVKVTSITLDSTSLIMKKDSKVSLIAKISPSNANDIAVTWVSSNEDIVTVNSNGSVLAVAPGTATIKCTAKDGSGKFETCVVTVTEVNLSDTDLSIIKGNTITLTATVLSSNSSDKGVTWTSSDETVATVDANGKVTAIKAGTTTITCTANDGIGASDKCTVTVKLIWEFDEKTGTIIRYNGSDSEMNIPNTINGVPVRIIGFAAFRYCNIETLIIPNGVTIIGDEAFSWCEKLKKITIPDSVTSIGSRAFDYVGNDYGYFDIIIPNSVISIGSNAFFGSGVREISLPESVTSIGSGTFGYCGNLTRIIIPSGVTSIEDYMFYTGDAWYSSTLKSVFIPDSVTSIGNKAFLYCDDLESITFPKNLMSIGKEAFLDCFSLRDIIIPDSIISIGIGAFDGCRNAIFYVSSERVKQLLIDSGVDEGKLVVTTPPPPPPSNPLDFDFNKETGTITKYNGSDTDIVIPDMIDGVDVKHIGYGAFLDYSSLTRIIIPNSVTSIDACAFKGCGSLTSITIPNSITNIGYLAFEGCTNVTFYVSSESVRQLLIEDGIDSGRIILFGQTGNDTLFSYLDDLVSLAYEYANNNTLTGNQLVLMFIRQFNSSYIDSSWDIVAGKIDSGFIEYVRKENPRIEQYFSGKLNIIDTKLGEGIELTHFAATLGGLLYSTSWDDGTSFIKKLQAEFMPESHLNNLCGWAGDLQTLMVQIKDKTNDSSDYNIVYNETKKAIGSSDYSFPMTDLLADVDTVNICNILGSSKLVDTLKNYYNSELDTRYSNFVQNVAGSTNKETFKVWVNCYTNSTYFAFSWPLFGDASFSLSQSSASADAFVDYLWDNI